MSGINPNRPIESNCTGSQEQPKTMNQKNQPNNVWVAYKAEGQVDITDIQYTNKGDECKDITNFVAQNNGKNWTDELKNEIQKLIAKYNRDRAFAEALNGDWKEVTLQKPIQAPVIDHPPVYYNGDDEKSNLSAEDKIKQSIINLAPGEKYQYVEKKEALGFKQQNTVTVERQEDGSLVETRLGNVARKAVRLKTVYNENYTQKISEDFVDPRKNQWGVVSTKYYNESGKPSHVQTDLKNLNTLTGITPIIIDLQNASKTYKKQTISDSDGNVLFEIKNGVFYNHKGKEIDSDKVWNKLNKAMDQGKLKTLYQEY